MGRVVAGENDGDGSREETAMVRVAREWGTGFLGQRSGYKVGATICDGGGRGRQGGFRGGRPGGVDQFPKNDLRSCKRGHRETQTNADADAASNMSVPASRWPDVFVCKKRRTLVRGQPIGRAESLEESVIETTPDEHVICPMRRESIERSP